MERNRRAPVFAAALGSGRQLSLDMDVFVTEVEEMGEVIHRRAHQSRLAVRRILLVGATRTAVMTPAVSRVKVASSANMLRSR
jgi:hypothetical protein